MAGSPVFILDKVGSEGGRLMNLREPGDAPGTEYSPGYAALGATRGEIPGIGINRLW